MKRNKRALIVGLIVVVLIVIAAIPKINFGGGEEMNKPAAAGSSVLPVKAHIIAGEEISDNLTTSGTVLANEEVELRSETAGKIMKILFKEGSPVKKGELLVKINDAELQAQLERAKYRLKLLQDREFRQKTLLEREAISQEEYDVALNELNVNRSELELIKAQIEKTEIRAPFDGVIGLKYVSEGSFVNSSTVIAALQDISPVKIDFSIPEKYAGDVKPGDEISFHIAGSADNYKGKVYAVEPRIDQQTRTLRIRALADNSSGRIVPGAFADVKLVLKNIENAIMVPTFAVVPELKGQKVYLYKSGKVEPRSVETGIRTDQRIQVTSGIEETDTLITSGILQVKPGMPVTISEFN